MTETVDMATEEVKRSELATNSLLEKADGDVSLNEEKMEPNHGSSDSVNVNLSKASSQEQEQHGGIEDQSVDSHHNAIMNQIVSLEISEDNLPDEGDLDDHLASRGVPHIVVTPERQNSDSENGNQEDEDDIDGEENDRFLSPYSNFFFPKRLKASRMHQRPRSMSLPAIFHPPLSILHLDEPDCYNSSARGLSGRPKTPHPAGKPHWYGHEQTHMLWKRSPSRTSFGGQESSSETCIRELFDDSDEKLATEMEKRMEKSRLIKKLVKSMGAEEFKTRYFQKLNSMKKENAAGVAKKKVVFKETPVLIGKCGLLELSPEAKIAMSQEYDDDCSDTEETKRKGGIKLPDIHKKS